MLKNIASRFLLVFLSIETILQEPTIYQRRQKLGAMRNGLDLGGAYETMLGRIKAQGGKKSKLGMAVLMWISHSRRPLHVDEICCAVAIRIGSNDLNNDSVRKRPVRPGFGSAWAGLGFARSRPGRTVGRSPASEAHLTGPGRTADICRLSSDKM